jgi:hypothetical protein
LSDDIIAFTAFCRFISFFILLDWAFLCLSLGWEPSETSFLFKTFYLDSLHSLRVCIQMSFHLIMLRRNLHDGKALNATRE